MEYPNELVKAVKAVADAINGEGGGGGESDFSIAHITVVGHDELGIKGAFLISGTPMGDITMYTNTTNFSNNVILYKGKAAIEVVNAPDSVSGNISVVGGGFYLVTGDCTLNYTE